MKSGICSDCKGISLQASEGSCPRVPCPHSVPHWHWRCQGENEDFKEAGNPGSDWPHCLLFLSFPCLSLLLLRWGKERHCLPGKEKHATGVKGDWGRHRAMCQTRWPSSSAIQRVASRVLGDLWNCAQCSGSERTTCPDRVRNVQLCMQVEDQQWKSDVMIIFENMKNSYRKMTTNRTSRQAAGKRTWVGEVSAPGGTAANLCGVWSKSQEK